MGIVAALPKKIESGTLDPPAYFFVENIPISVFQIHLIFIIFNFLPIIPSKSKVTPMHQPLYAVKTSIKR